jgi:hypothetical protein
MLLEDESYGVDLASVRYREMKLYTDTYQEEGYALWLTQLSVLQLLGKSMPEKQNCNQSFARA